MTQFDIAPADPSDTRAQGFGGRFLHGKKRGEIFRHGPAQKYGALRICQYFFMKAGIVYVFFETRHNRNINPDHGSNL
jgi:hypothetical protein